MRRVETRREPERAVHVEPAHVVRAREQVRPAPEVHRAPERSVGSAYTGSQSGARDTRDYSTRGQQSRQLMNQPAAVTAPHGLGGEHSVELHCHFGPTQSPEVVHDPSKPPAGAVHLSPLHVPSATHFE